MNGVRRLCCIFLLLPTVTVHASAAHKLDGVIGRTEYNGSMQQLISARHESNNDVSMAYLIWDISEEDYSIYVAVKYMCDDVGILLGDPEHSDRTEPDETAPDVAAAIELSVNGSVCATAYRDGSFPDLDQNRYDAESCFSFAQSDTGKPDTNNFVAEIRLGLKYWMPYDSTLGIRIFDCAGSPSNLYTVEINPSPTQTTAAAQSNTTVRAQSTVPETATDPASSTTGKPKATRRVILAAKANVNPTTFARPTTVSETSAQEKETSPKTNKEQAVETTTANLTAKPAVSAYALPVSEPSATVASEGATSVVWTPAVHAADAVRLNRLRDAGVVSGTVLITLAAMISVIGGLRAKENKAKVQKPPAGTEIKTDPCVPENDDF